MAAPPPISFAIPASTSDPFSQPKAPNMLSLKPSKEHVLIVLFGPEPKAVINRIKERFSWVESVDYVRVDDIDNFADVVGISSRVEDELWKKATILVTLFALPMKESLVPRLKHIQFFSAGIDFFAKHPLFHPVPTTIPMSTCTGIAAPPIAEHTVMTLLSLTKRLPTQLSWQRQHHWGPKQPFQSSIGDWVGKTVGIYGYGSIGRHVGRIMTALGAVVHAYTSLPRDTPTSRRDRNYCVPGTGDPLGHHPTRWFSGTTTADLHAFLSSGLHALVVAVPLTPSTRHVLGADEFALLQTTSPHAPSPHYDAPGGPAAGAFLVNVSRGAVLDQAALVDALKRRVLRGAALDVTDPEPLDPKSELWDLDNCIVTPHTSGVGSEYVGRGYDVLFENLGRWERGEDVLNLIRLGRGY